MKSESPKVQFITIDEQAELQRIDNFLKNVLKGVPKSMIYRIIRKGEVRVNKKRIKPEYKLQIDDVVRVPPVKVEEKQDIPSINLNKVKGLESQIIFEDDHIIILNKPSGLAVHGGSGLNFGVIESLRALRPQAKFLELVHRLDRDTSGCLLVAKKRSALRALHEQLREKTMKKRYWALVRGKWQKGCNKVNAPLFKNVLKSGERVVKVSAEGKPSETRFKILKSYSNATLVEAMPITGRTHQIRVHTLHVGHCIACDDKYGDAAFDAQMKEHGLNRLFLHAHSLEITHPKTGKKLNFVAPVDYVLDRVMKSLEH